MHSSSLELSFGEPNYLSLYLTLELFFEWTELDTEDDSEYLDPP
jgi:hypothetical protein